MFRHMTTAAQPLVTVHVDGRAVQARAGETLALALLNAGVTTFRHTPISAQPRAPLCLMGVCFDCLVEVDAQQNVQSCMVEVRDGMSVRLQSGARQARQVP